MQLLNFITWTASPVLFSLGPIEIRWYSLMFIIGFWIGFKIEENMFKREGIPPVWLDKLFMFVFIGTIIGARLGHVFFYGWEYYSQHPAEIFKVWEGGLASHGGAIGIIIAIFILAYGVLKVNPLFLFDRLVVPVALVGALIRMGNLFNHEIYGHPTTLPWGFKFIENLHAWKAGAQPIFSLPSHPTQIYEATIYLIVFALLMWMYWKRDAQLRQGLIFGVFLIGIFGTRIFIEFLKNNQEAFEDTMLLNMGQILSIPFVIIGIWLIIRAYLRPKEKPFKTDMRLSKQKA
ncbi:MAG: prolipoprotein diacylglyceryl transferase [Bacteroidales bacterium]